MHKPRGRPSDIKNIYNRHYKLGQCVAALRIHGELTSSALAEIAGIGSHGIKTLLTQCDAIKMRLVDKVWNYETMGRRKNYSVKRSVWAFSLREV